MTTSALVAAALYALPALVWAVIARRQSWYVRLRRPRSRGLRMLPLVGWAVAAHYGLQLALTLAPLGLHDDPSRAVESPIALVWEGVQVAAANGTARLRVSDTGPGVPEDAMARLFEPFFSLKANGTGLGLAIAKRTLEAHGGRITAAIRPQGGMTFEVDLPLAGAHAA